MQSHSQIKRRLITLSYAPNLAQYFVARAMNHELGQLASQSCQLLPSVKSKIEAVVSATEGCNP